MKLTIPELAEQLRHHIDNDNDAKRLIGEHVLPLIGIDLPPEEVSGLKTRIELLGEISGLEDELSKAEDALLSAKDNLSSDITRYGEVIPEEVLDALKATLDSIKV